jgi:exosome complex component MTR3
MMKTMRVEWRRINIYEIQSIYQKDKIYFYCLQTCDGSRMSKDSRRIVGPEGSVPYSAYMPAPAAVSRGARAPDTQRKVFLKTEVVSQAKGSAYLEQGGTKLMAAVYGPREVAHRRDFSMRGQLTAELKFAPFACKTRRGQQADQEEEELGLVVAEALASTVCLHRYPKACIEVFITVLEDDGAVLAAALTAAGLALADAGIHMFDLVVGVSVAVEEGGRLVADPGRDSSHRAEVTVGWLPSLEQAVACLAEGRLLPGELQAVLAAATRQAAALLPAVQLCLVERLERRRAAAPQD